MPGTVESNSAAKQWSIRYLPSRPLELPRPPGASIDEERSRMLTELTDPAQRKTTLEVATDVAFVRVSTSRTPETRRLAGAYSRASTTVSVITVRRPVAFAAGSVELCVLK